jgi:hypothetical protein
MTVETVGGKTDDQKEMNRHSLKLTSFMHDCVTDFVYVPLYWLSILLNLRTLFQLKSYIFWDSYSNCRGRFQCAILEFELRSEEISEQI